jgi:single-strand DNA-binding protein
MASLNRCDFIGRVGKDPEVRFTAAGTAVANTSIACSEKFKNKSGEWEEKTEWVNLVFWGKLAEIVGEYVEKGKEIYVSGRLQTRKYQDRDGKDRYSTEVNCDKMQMLGGKGEGSRQSQEPAYKEPEYDDNSDIPF